MIVRAPSATYARMHARTLEEPYTLRRGFTSEELYRVRQTTEIPDGTSEHGVNGVVVAEES